MRDGAVNQGTLMYTDCQLANSSEYYVLSILKSYIHIFLLIIDVSISNKSSVTVVRKILTVFCLWFLKGEVNPWERCSLLFIVDPDS